MKILNKIFYQSDFTWCEKVLVYVHLRLQPVINYTMQVEYTLYFMPKENDSLDGSKAVFTRFGQ